MTSEDLTRELERTGALLKGHFLLSSGLHSTRYLQCAKLLQYPDLAERIGSAIAAKFAGMKIDVVAAPAIGGIIVAHEVARALGVRAVFSERENDVMTFRRGLEIREGERAVVVEDVITTGGSSVETMKAVQAAGGNVVGLGSIIDRSGGKAKLDFPIHSLLQVDFPVYQPDNLPPELQGSTAVKPGSRKR
jgi:orotate phosphoribosyltransferase